MTAKKPAQARRAPVKRTGAQNTAAKLRTPAATVSAPETCPKCTRNDVQTATVGRKTVYRCGSCGEPLEGVKS